ncbi:hypothetical protein M0R45_018291 [Rubus argutus]|uniref:Uncharacterized protein n=1 Tax=Rubus argutus TaxID=59490 RepID=A0AAW1X250_RUBAR
MDDMKIFHGLQPITLSKTHQIQNQHSHHLRSATPAAQPTDHHSAANVLAIASIAAADPKPQRSPPPPSQARVQSSASIYGVASSSPAPIQSLTVAGQPRRRRCSLSLTTPSRRRTTITASSRRALCPVPSPYTTPLLAISTRAHTQATPSPIDAVQNRSTSPSIASILVSSSLHLSLILSNSLCLPLLSNLTI